MYCLHDPLTDTFYFPAQGEKLVGYTTDNRSGTPCDIETLNLDRLDRLLILDPVVQSFLTSN